MSLIVVNVYLFVMAVVLALLEIQIEGEHGWAKHLPTWRPQADNWLARLYRRVMGGKELTGYHLAMFGFVLMVFHLPFVLGLPFGLNSWLRIISYYFLFMVVWDFLWFVMNPHHPLSFFATPRNPVHLKFLGPLPLDYYGGLVLSFVVLLPLTWGNAAAVVGWWLTNVILFAVQTLIVVWFTLKVLKIDNWVNRQ